MKRLVELVDVVEDNEKCVLLKTNCESIELMLLGCFLGNEDYIRLTKGKDHTCTIWYKNGNSFSWDWGYSGNTRVSERLNRVRYVVVECIKKDLKIDIE